MTKLAVLIPGMGYGTNQPLFEASERLARQRGYEVVSISYSGMPKSAETEEEKEAVAKKAYEQVEKQLSKVKFDSYDEILFISKSVGTVAAARFVEEKKIDPEKTRQVFYTPLKNTFDYYSGEKGVVYYGTKDPWTDASVIREGGQKNGFTMRPIDHATHSLESGDVIRDLTNLLEMVKELSVILGK